MCCLPEKMEKTKVRNLASTCKCARLARTHVIIHKHQCLRWTCLGSVFHLDLKGSLQPLLSCLRDIKPIKMRHFSHRFYKPIGLCRAIIHHLRFLEQEETTVEKLGRTGGRIKGVTFIYFSVHAATHRLGWSSMSIKTRQLEPAP